MLKPNGPKLSFFVAAAFPKNKRFEKMLCQAVWEHHLNTLFWSLSCNSKGKNHIKYLITLFPPPIKFYIQLLSNTGQIQQLHGKE